MYLCYRGVIKYFKEWEWECFRGEGLDLEKVGVLFDKILILIFD